LLGVGVIILSYANSVGSLIAAAVFYGIGYGMVNPAIHAWIVNLAPPHRRGSATGTFYSAIDVGIGLGTVVLGGIANLTGYAVMYRLSAFLFLIFLVIYLTHLMKERKRKKKTDPPNVKFLRRIEYMNCRRNVSGLPSGSPFARIAALL
jgi:MFS family permease